MKHEFDNLGCCRPSLEGEHRPGVYVVPAENVTEVRDRFLEQETARRAVESSARRGHVQRLVDRFALADILEDLRDAVTRRWAEHPSEQPKQRNTIRVKLRDLVQLCESYGL